MLHLNKYIAVAVTTIAASWAMTGCQDDFDAPGLDTPVATMKPNTTIAQIKADYWNSADNYIDTIKLVEGQEHQIIAGRVISSDQSGNIYKSLVIQDETGALAMSINANSLYNQYRIGQEVVVDLTDMYIGKYSTLQQLGFPDYTPSYGWQATFMPLEFFKEHSQLNGLPEPSKIDTLTLNISDLGNGEEALRRYQSRLVRFNNVFFVDGGEKAFCDGHKVNTNRTLKDDNGNEIIVRTSGYANYWSMMLPAEHGDIVGILSTYKQSGTLKWQLVMRSPSDLLNFGTPTLPKGTETNPYDVVEAIEMVNGDHAVAGWYTGYIVGSIKAGVSSVGSADDISFSADAELDNNLIIGQSAESASLDDCMLVRLPADSPLMKYGNLVDHPENYGKQIWLRATPGTQLGMKAFTGNTGAADQWRIEGVTVPGDNPGGSSIPEGDGTESKPYNPTQVVAMGTGANVADKWVSGYIVGWVDNSTQNYADEKNCHFSVPATTATNVLLASTPGETDYTKCCIANLPNTNNIRAAVNLVDNPSNLGRVVSVLGTIRKYFAIPGVRDLTAYKLGEGGGDTPTPPSGDAVTSLSMDFEGSTSIPAGWTATETSGNAKWFIRNYNNNNSAEITAFGSSKNPGADGFISWLISPALNVDGMSSKTLSFKSMVGYSGNGTLEVFVMTSADPSKAQLTKLNANIPAATGSWGDWVESGSLSLAGFSGTVYIGFRYNAPAGSSYTTYRVDDIVAGEGGGSDTPNPPAGDTNSADLNTLDAKSSYGTYTTASGWAATNAAVQSGGEADNNPVFKFIGSADTHAVCLNGKVSTPGSLVSPTLGGGIKKLTFNYGFAFSDKQCKFTVNIKQGGSVVKTQTVDMSSVTKFEVYNFSMDVNVSGDFVIEIVNDCKTGTDKNVDRVSIWNITWTK